MLKFTDKKDINPYNSSDYFKYELFNIVKNSLQDFDLPGGVKIKVDQKNIVDNIAQLYSKDIAAKEAELLNKYAKKNI